MDEQVLPTASVHVGGMLAGTGVAAELVVQGLEQEVVLVLELAVHVVPGKAAEEEEAEVCAGGCLLGLPLCGIRAWAPGGSCNATSSASRTCGWPTGSGSSGAQGISDMSLSPLESITTTSGWGLCPASPLKHQGCTEESLH